ncbi:MAG TPA: DUF2304 domain-containing protein [Bacilli bacterium]|nr:DUF2304 domain-containing protein [Bacilli bacterium]
MSLGLTLASIIFLVLIMLIIDYLVIKRKISIKYSLVFIFPCLVLIIFTLVPGFMELVSNFIGFKTPSNMILTLLIGFLMTIVISLTVIVSNQKDKIRLLIQEISMIKEQINKKELDKEQKKYCQI